MSDSELGAASAGSRLSQSAPPSGAGPVGRGPRHEEPGRGRSMWRRVIIGLALVAVLQALLALCLVSADQKLLPHNMPFGVTGSSPVTQAVQSKLSLTVATYPNQTAALDAVNQGKIYGAYVPGSSSDTLIVVPQKSFFSYVILEAAFTDAAHKLGRPVVVDTVKPLPERDRLGGVTGLLLLPLLIGGFFAAVFILKATGSAAARWRVAILLGYAVVGAFLTDLIAGPLIGAYTSDRFWPLLPGFILIIAAVALASAAIQRLAGRLGTLIVAVVFIVLGLASAGGLGLSLLPVFWQTLGTALPPQHAITLIRNTLYFNGNNITVPLIVLGVYAVAGAAVIAYLGWYRDTRAHAAARRADPEAAAAARRKAVVAILGALAIAAVMQCLFSSTYMSSGHSPVASRMPFGTVGPSPLLTQVQQQGYSLALTQYPNQSAATQAIDEGKLFGALVPATTSPNTLYVVASQSDVAPLDLTDQFEQAAKTVGQPLQVKQYSPTPLPAGDPYGLVLSIMLVPLLIGGYMASTILMSATATPTAPWRVATLFGFAVVGGLLVNLVVGVLRGGYPLGKFWFAWPISSLTILAVALLASVLQKLLGAAGTLLTVIVVILLGNPSSGGANGVPYLPDFWRDIGPYLPPRNAYLLLHNTVYFDGHGITQYLTVLLIYAVVAGVISSLLGWFRTPKIPVSPETEVDAAAMTSAAAAAPP